MTGAYNSATQMDTSTRTAGAAAPSDFSSNIFNAIQVDTDVLRSFANEMKSHAEDLKSAVGSYKDAAVDEFLDAMKRNTADGNPPPILGNFLNQYGMRVPEGLYQLDSFAQAIISHMDNMLEYANSVESVESDSTQRVHGIPSN